MINLSRIRLLTGEGSQVREMKIKSAGQLPSEWFTVLLNEGVCLALMTREERQLLKRSKE